MAGSVTPPPSSPADGSAQPPQGDGGFVDTLARTDPAVGFHDGRGRDAGDRISVYRNNVVVSLADAIATTFPATGRLVGEAFLRAAAIAFAKAHKPRSPLMFHYGDGFADFIQALPGLADYPQVPEVARIEYARVCAYHAKDAAPLAAEVMAAIAPDALPTVVFSPHPATRLVATPHNGLAAFQANHAPPLPITDGVAAALVTRPLMEVLTHALDDPSHHFIGHLLGGASLGEAAAASPDTLDLGAALGVALTAGAFTDCRATPP